MKDIPYAAMSPKGLQELSEGVIYARYSRAADPGLQAVRRAARSKGREDLRGPGPHRHKR